jgi:hypothetical protein
MLGMLELKESMLVCYCLFYYFVVECWLASVLWLTTVLLWLLCWFVADWLLFNATLVCGFWRLLADFVACWF